MLADLLAFLPHPCTDSWGEPRSPAPNSSAINTSSKSQRLPPTLSIYYISGTWMDISFHVYNNCVKWVSLLFWCFKRKHQICGRWVLTQVSKKQHGSGVATHQGSRGKILQETAFSDTYSSAQALCPWLICTDNVLIYKFYIYHTLNISHHSLGCDFQVM